MGRLRRPKIKSGSTPTLRDRAAGMVGADAHRKSMTQLAREHDALLLKRMESLSAMPAASRAAANLILSENNAPLDAPFQTTYTDPWSAMEYDDDVAEEPTDISHEGGEVDEATRAAAEHILQIPSKQYSRWDVRSRRDRLQAAHAHWEQQMPQLVAAYLEWKHGNSIGSMQCDAADRTLFDIVAIKTHGREALRIPQQQNELANVALLREGLLGCSPVSPTVAISLDTLELYHRLRRHHPQLGIQPVMRALCDIHDVNYTNTLREQFANAFDAYLDILRRVQHKVDAALGHGMRDWRVKNACHCCDLKLEGETELNPAKLMALDGNNSAKRVASAGTEDRRTFTSDYILSRGDVDRFKDEVKRKLSRKKTSEENEKDDDAEAEADAPWISEEAPGEAPDGQQDPSPCTERWKASAAEHEKRALDIYETTGIFVSACRHGFIQKACEMVRSGELAKYPLAIVSHLIDVQGSNLGFGYDIGCAFRETVKQSPLVGPKALSQCTQFCVCAFHGYAHNRLCQLRNHPLYLSGFGIEDLEVMERVFSASNAVARGIRYASSFHWAQSIDLHFRQWDDDKYAELSRFLLNNYRQALSIIAENTPEIEALKAELTISDDEIAQWRNTEREFLESLKEEPEERILECAYVQALIDRQNADARLDQVRADFHNTSSSRPFNYAKDARDTARIEAARRAATHRLTTAIMAVADLEAKLDLAEPWTPTHPKYKEVLEYVQHRQFHRALDRVEQLVVQRLGELAKANVSGMGYKLRTTIWRSLKTRAKAIRNAIKQYNVLAATMKPPAPLLEWKDVVNYTFLSEFELLRNSYSRRDILSEKWTNPRNRGIMAKYFKAVGARDELTRLDCEVRRLRTGILVEHEEFEHAVKQTLPVDALLAAEVRAQQKVRMRVNNTHIARLRTIETLSGYTGTFGTGIPVERGRSLMIARTACTYPDTDLSTDSVVGSGTDIAEDDTVLGDEHCNNDIIRFAEVLEGFGAMTLDG